MEEEGKSQIGNRSSEPDFVLQWGNRKRLRCVKIKEPHTQSLTNKSNCLGKKKITSRVDRRVVSADKEFPSPQLHGPNKNLSSPMTNQKTSVITSPEKEDRYYMTRGSMGVDEKVMVDQLTKDDRIGGGGGVVWPKLFISLSSKEKEEDFMAMKGCKLPQRPKKRAKLLQRSLLLVMPGTWLSDLCQERYEVREKKVSKKRPRGLKAMGSMDSESD